MEEQKTNNRKFAEFLLAFYYSSFSLLKPINITFKDKSTYILLGMVVVVLCIFLWKTHFKLSRPRMAKWACLCAFVTIVFLGDYIFRRTTSTWDCYYYFIIYCMIPLLIMTEVNDFFCLLKYWSIFAVIGGFEFALDPFNSYAWSSDYMQFGSGIMLPAFAGAIVIASHFKVKMFWPVSFIFLAEILIGGNKGAFLSAFAILILGLAYLSTDGKFHILRGMSIFAFIVVFYLAFDTILKIMIDYATSKGISSYALRTFQYMLNDSQSSVYSVRLDIWASAWMEFKQHFLLGMGIGGFNEIYHNYAHNFILDMLVSHGLIVSVPVFIFLICSTIRSFRFYDLDKKVFSLVILFLWFFPTFVSHTFWKMMPFWLFVGIHIFFSKESEEEGVGRFESTIS